MNFDYNGIFFIVKSRVLVVIVMSLATPYFMLGIMYLAGETMTETAF